jgi:hypothetical protein
MNDVVGCRDMELLCRHRAVFDTQHRGKWLGEADRWRDLAHGEATARFHGDHPGPMNVGPNATENDRRKMRISQFDGRNSPLDNCSGGPQASDLAGESPRTSRSLVISNRRIAAGRSSTIVLTAIDSGVFWRAPVRC